MKPTLVQYDAPGWGVGEVWLDEDGRVFYSELPAPASERPQSRLRRGSGVGPAVCRRFAGVAVSFHDVPLAIPDGFYGDCARALLTVPRGGGRHLRRAGGARRAARRRAGGRDVLRPLRSCATAPGAPRRLGRWARQLGRTPKRTTNAGSWSSKMSLSDDLRDELAQIAPARRCCRLAELSALFHASGPGTCAVGTSPSTSTSRARRSRGAPSPCCAISESLGGSAPIRAARSTGRRDISSTSTSTDMRSTCCARPVSSPRRARRWSTRRSASSGARVAAARISAARS